MNRTKPLAMLTASLLLIGALTGASCHHRGKKRNPFDLGRSQGGVTASSFQSLNDYLRHPTVREILSCLVRHPGNTPPEIGGTYAALGTVISTTIPGVDIGDEGEEDFCFGLQIGTELEVVVANPILEQSGARYFIEGSGDSFTVYAAFTSRQSADGGGNCTIHQVNVYSGRLLPNGDLADFAFGFGIVGLSGDCDPLLVGDLQVSEAAGPAELIIENGGFDPDLEPVDPNKVLVQVDNILAADIEVFFNLDQSLPSSFVVPANSVGEVEMDPGFSLTFFALTEPLVDEFGDDFLIEDFFQGDFPTDCTPAGAVTAYTITNEVGIDTFFAPEPVNLTSTDIDVDVNAIFCPPCLPLPPSPLAQHIGYYFYDLPGIIECDPAFPADCEVDIRAFRADNGLEIGSGAQGPFDLDAVRPGSGIVEIDVVE